MAKELPLKDVLAKILMEYYNMELIFTRLENDGVRMGALLGKYPQIVLEAVGFPRDNSRDYDFRHHDLGTPRDETKKLVDDDYFPDDWLTDYYFELTQKLSEEKKIVVTEAGVKVSEADNLQQVQEKIYEYIDWVYGEYDKYERGEKPWVEYFDNLEEFSGNEDENKDEDDDEDEKDADKL